MAKKGFLDGYKTYDTSEGFGSAAQWRKAFNARMSKDEATAILDEQEKSPWQLLEVPPGASKTEIKKAFRKLMMEWHPDLNQHRLEEAEAKSKAIIAAYSLLTS